MFCKVVRDIFPADPDINNIGESQYEDCIKRREIWDNLGKISPSDVQTIIIPFLNKWRCRLSGLCFSDLTAALQKTEQSLIPLRKLGIENLDVIGAIQNTPTAVNAFSYIERSFRNIQEVKAGAKTVGFTATSKILHMAIPELFVMSDNAIRRKYGCEGNAAGYVNFIVRMNLTARDLILQANGNKQTILECSKYNGRSLARLLDNYNYTMFTLNKQTLFQ